VTELLQCTERCAQSGRLPVPWRDFLGALAGAVGAPPPRTMPGWLFRRVPSA
jgi:hypothetical protein